MSILAILKGVAPWVFRVANRLINARPSYHKSEPVRVNIPPGLLTPRGVYTPPDMSNPPSCFPAYVDRLYPPREGGAPQGPQAFRRVTTVPPTFLIERVSWGDAGDASGWRDRRSAGVTDEKEALQEQTRRLLGRFFAEFAGLSAPDWRESEALSALKRVTADILREHGHELRGLIQQLLEESGGGDLAFVPAVARLMFADRVVSWERVVTLLAFGAALCQHVAVRGSTRRVELVAREITDYLLCEHGAWLLRHGAWDGLGEHFEGQDQKAPVGCLVLALVGLAGVGAALAYGFRGT